MTARDQWAGAAAYEPYVGRWSRLVAVGFLDWLAVPPGRRWLDVGCGTGALTGTIVERCQPASVLGVDSSAAYAGWAAAHVDDGRVRFEVADAAHLPAVEVDVAVSGLVLNFLPDPAAALAGWRGVAVPGGLVAAYVWDYAGGMELIRRFWDAAVALDPGAAPLDEAVRFPLCRPEPLAELWRGAGLAEVGVRALDVPTPFRHFDDLWEPFLGGQGPAPSYVASLDGDGRAALRRRLRESLPIGGDGSISLRARAWAVRGRVPGV